jgi:transcriptional regulator with XRE-family HTH domain
MFEPLCHVIRLRRMQRNLTQEGLAKLAGVSRRQLSLLEEGRNTSLLFLTKVARVLELTELPIGDLRLRASQPELSTIVLAAETLERLKPFLPVWAGAAEQIHDASASLEQLIGKTLASGPLAGGIGEAAERLANTPAEERGATAETLRSLTRPDSAIRPTQLKSAVRKAARRRGR